MRMRTKVMLGVASVLVAVGAFFALNTQAMSSYRDCEDDTIIRCGALSQAELLQKYDQNVGDVQHIYAHYGITRDLIAGDYKVGTVYQDGRVVVDGKVVATGAYSVSRIAFTDKNGNKPRPVTINGTTLYEGPNMSIFLQPVDAFVYFKNGQFYKAVLSACGNPLMATPEKPQPKPVYTCDNLTATKVTAAGDRRYSFTAAATAKDGATITNYTYDFGDGSKQTTSATTVEHDYAKTGTFTATLTVNFNVNGTATSLSGANCKATITIKEQPVTPVYSCDMLTPTLITTKDRTYSFALSYTAEGGATFDKVTYDFGDGNKQTTSATTVQHTYADAGSYKIVATVYFNVKNGNTTTSTSKNCEATVKIVPPEMCPIKPSVPKDSPECTPCPYNPELPKDSDQCVPPVTPPELPKTGIGTFIGGGVGFGSIAAAAYYFVGSRKNLFDALLNR